KKQIVLTSDRPPKEIYTLQERIKTRFTQGMIVDVQPPEYELRLAIIRKKAEKANLNIPSDVLAFLAEKLNSNIREIEGALKKIGAVSFLNGVPITLEMVKSSIPEYFRENKPVAETVDNILEVTARKYEVSVEQILGKSRTKDIKTARNVAMYVIKKVLDLSLPAIGKMMNRDHSTVYSNIQMIETDLETNDKLNNDIIEIVTEIKSGK
ncbi:MAG: DnaA/Hda family protein, partial [Clostridia bacterium]|nr:DnaA/Hda family protein [Clostridia bacterium]